MAESWVPGADASGFGIHHLPYGVFTTSGEGRRPGVRIGDRVLDLAGLARAGLVPDPAATLTAPTLNPHLAEGPGRWREVREAVGELLSDDRRQGEVEPHLHRLEEVELSLPWEVADYVDFYSSLQHATNLGRMFRPEGEPLLPNWRYLPVGYHGRAGTVVVSGTPIPRPHGQRRGERGPVFGPSQRLDIEAEVGFVVGVGSRLGSSVAVGDFTRHVFGVVVVNDWSARDIQAWEYQPLGPFLGKSFATSAAAWITPLAALDAARVPPPPQDPEPLPYLADPDPWSLDLRLEVALNGEVVSRPPFATTYWTPGQQLAHLTSNGASLRTGDLFASGTVSGADPDGWGSLIELTWNGERPLELGDGSTRVFLEDGDEVVIGATAPAVGGGAIRLGEVAGRILPAG